MELVKRNKIAGILGSVVICYLAGFAYAYFFPQFYNPKVADNLINVSVPLAIALLLFSTKVKDWLTHSRSSMISFLLLIVSVVSCNLIWFMVYNDKTTIDLWKVSGMFTAVYIGGTPNLLAIGHALRTPDITIAVANASDVLNSGIYFLLLITVAQKLLLNFLPSFVPIPDNPRDETFHFGRIGMELSLTQLAAKMLLAFVLASLVFATSVGVSILLKNELDIVIILLAVSALSLGLSFIKPIQELPKTYEFGEYFLCIFCLGLGTKLQFDSLIHQQFFIFKFDVMVMWSSILFHFLLSKLFKIDADTTLITSTAGIFGPHFIGPVASVLKNKQIVVTGITTGLMGYAVANFVGLSVAYLARYLSQ